MKTLKHPGICKICGELKDMSPEHIPPKNAFNSNKVTVLPFEEIVKIMTGEDGRMPWDTQGLKGKVQQGGYRKYCLCHSCNNNTGQWYIRSYTDLAKTVHTMIVSENFSVGSSYSFLIKDLYPLRLYKAMMTMMCDINNDCFGDNNLRQSLLNKEVNNIDTSRYSLYMFLVSTQMPRINSISGIMNLSMPNDAILVSEIASYPIGFALYLDKPQNYTPFGLNVDDFAKFDYNTKCDIRFNGMPYLDINTQFPADYRSKEDIIECIESTKESMNNHDE